MKIEPNEESKGPFFWHQPYQPYQPKKRKKHGSTILGWSGGRRKHYIMLHDFWIKNNRNTPSLLLFFKKKAVRLSCSNRSWEKTLSTLWKKARQERETNPSTGFILFGKTGWYSWFGWPKEWTLRHNNYYLFIFTFV